MSSSFWHFSYTLVSWFHSGWCCSFFGSPFVLVVHLCYLQFATLRFSEVAICFLVVIWTLVHTLGIDNICPILDVPILNTIRQFDRFSNSNLENIANVDRKSSIDRCAMRIKKIYRICSQTFLFCLKLA